MRSVRGLLHLLLISLLFPVPASAFRSRPVSQLRFDGASSGFGPQVASDGEDFMVLQTYYDTGAYHTYVQKIERGAAAGPRLLIGRGTAAGIAWNGTEYLAAWSNDKGLWVARVSREGALLASPASPAAIGNYRYFAANQRTAIAIGYASGNGLLAQPLDLSGRAAGAAAPIAYPEIGEPYLAVGALNDGFGVAILGSNDFSFVHLNADGTTRGSAVLEAKRVWAAEVTATGKDALVVFSEGAFNQSTELKSAIVNAQGTLKRAAHTIYSSGLSVFDPVGIAWDGTQYVVALTTAKGRYTFGTAALLRLDRDGDPLGEVTAMTVSASDLAWNGHELLLPSEAAVVTASLAPFSVSASKPLGRTIAEQHGLALAASNGQYLAAWSEFSEKGVTVRATRIDAAGNYLDGEGIVLAEGTGTPPISIDSDGTSWLVIWADGRVHGARLSRSGVKLDEQSFGISGNEAMVRWNGARYIIASITGGKTLVSLAVNADGTIGTPAVLARGIADINLRSPSLAIAGDKTLLVFDAGRTTCSYNPQPYCFTDTSVHGLRLDAFGGALDPAPFTLDASLKGPRAVVAGQSQYLVAGSRVFTFLPVSAPQNAGALLPLDPDAWSPDAVFDGSFLAVWRTSGGTAAATRIPFAGPATTSVMRLDDDERTSRIVVAAAPNMQTLMGFETQHSAYDFVPRAAVLFVSEIDRAALPPSAPWIAGAARVDQSLDVRWLQPPGGLLGISIEVRLSDGSWRALGVAAGGASSARVPLAGITGASAVRLRGWNAAGTSEPSDEVPIAMPKRRAIR